MLRQVFKKPSRAQLLAANLRLREPAAAVETPPNPPDSDLPAGCSLEAIPGGRFRALVGDKPLKHAEGKHSGKPVVFKGRENAIAALVRYLEHARSRS